MNLDIRRCKFYLFLLPSCLPPLGEAIPFDLFSPPLMHQMTKEHEENIQWIISILGTSGSSPRIVRGLLDGIRGRLYMQQGLAVGETLFFSSVLAMRSIIII